MTWPAPPAANFLDSVFAAEEKCDVASGYDIAQICLSGHVITTTARTSADHTENFCSRCGAQTITVCPQCKQPIRGFYHVPGIISLTRNYSRPAHCPNCGTPYPWTQSALKTAQDLAADSTLAADEKEAFNDALPDLV